MFRDITD